MGNVMDIMVVVANNGCFVNLPNKTFLVNEKEVKPSHKAGWYICEYPQKISVFKKRPNINHRYELIDPINFPNLPQVMPKDEVMENNGGYCEWKDGLKHLEGLYNLVSDPQSPELVDVPFNITSELAVDKNIGDSVFSYSVGKFQPITHEYAKVHGVNELFYPNIVHEFLPCTLTPKETFEIIRNHVKENINLSVAQITSDYDFHFEVKKLITLNKPVIRSQEVKTPTGRSYKNRKYRQYTVSHRDYTVFNMYLNWKQYGPDIVPFSGDSTEDLKYKIDSYLKDLMETINTPLIDCPHCNGMGVIVKPS